MEVRHHIHYRMKPYLCIKADLHSIFREDSDRLNKRLTSDDISVRFIPRRDDMKAFSGNPVMPGPTEETVVDDNHLAGVD